MQWKEFDDKARARFIRMYNDSDSYPTSMIASRFGISHSLVSEWAMRLGLSMRMAKRTAAIKQKREQQRRA